MSKHRRTLSVMIHQLTKDPWTDFQLWFASIIYGKNGGRRTKDPRLTIFFTEIICLYNPGRSSLSQNKKLTNLIRPTWKKKLEPRHFPRSHPVVFLWAGIKKLELAGVGFPGRTSWNQLCTLECCSIPSIFDKKWWKLDNVKDTHHVQHFPHALLSGLILRDNLKIWLTHFQRKHCK